MRISIAGKVCFVLLMIFSSVLVAITGQQAQREQAELESYSMQLAKQQAEHYAHYLDLLLLAPASTSLPQPAHQPLQPVPKLFVSAATPRLPQSIQAKLPFAASTEPMQSGFQLESRGQESWMVVVTPWQLNPQLTALGCTACQALSSTETFGWIRVEIPVTTALEKIEADVLKTALLLSLLFGAGVLLALYIIRRQVVSPLQRISMAMERASDLGDHTIRLPVSPRNDELSRLSENFNHLMDSLSPKR